MQVDGALLKHTARLCVDGRRQKKGMHFDKVFAPVASWSTAWLTLFLLNLLQLSSRQVNFIQASTQADADRDLHMETPHRWGTDKVSAKNRGCALKLGKNLHGSKAATRSWWMHLHRGLQR